MAPEGDYLWVGNTKVPILAYGDADICIQGPQDTMKIMRLFDVNYCEGFATNLVSLQRLQSLGYYWDNQIGYNSLKRGLNVAAYLKDKHSQFVLEDIPLDKPFMKQAFYLQWNLYNMWTK